MYLSSVLSSFGFILLPNYVNIPKEIQIKLLILGTFSSIYHLNCTLQNTSYLKIQNQDDEDKENMERLTKITECLDGIGIILFSHSSFHWTTEIFI